MFEKIFPVKLSFLKNLNEILYRAFAESDIDEVLIAGGFGNFINLENACRIGLLPKSLLSKIRPIGNAAGEGARIALVSKEARANLDMIQSRSRYIELAAHPDFADLYADHLPFESLDE